MSFCVCKSSNVVMALYKDNSHAENSANYQLQENYNAMNGHMGDHPCKMLADSLL